MGRCVIHIGMGKSGSTSIQSVLAANDDALGDMQIAYPRPNPRTIQHAYLAAAYIGSSSNRFPRSARHADGSPRDVNAFRAGVLDALRQTEKAILSAEFFFRFTGEEVAQLKSDLKAVGMTDVRVFCVLRDPVSVYTSVVPQTLRGSTRFPSPDQYYIRYAERTQAWMRHFPCEVRSHAELSKAPGGVVDGMLTCAGEHLGVDLSHLKAAAGTRNESLSPEEMQLLQDFRRRFYPRSDGRLNKATNGFVRLLELIRNEPVKRPILKPQAGAILARRHQDEVNRILDMTGLNIAPARSYLDLDLAPPPEGLVDVRDLMANFDSSQFRALRRQVFSRGPLAATQEVLRLLTAQGRALSPSQ